MGYKEGGCIINYPKAHFYVPGKGLVVAGNNTNVTENVLLPSTETLGVPICITYVQHLDTAHFFSLPEDAGIWSLDKYFSLLF